MILKYIKLLPIIIIMSISFSMGFAVPAKADASLKGAACAGLNSLAGTNAAAQTSTNCSPSGEGSISSLVSAIVKILSMIVGIAAVVMIIIAGFKFVVAGGEASKVASAKNTLVYALIGLAIAALAQFLVSFVFNQATSTTVCQTNSKILASDPSCK